MMILQPALQPRQVLPLEKVIAVGFGAAYVSRDGDTVWQEDVRADWNDLWTVAQAEQVAEEDPLHDWRIHIIGPLAEGHWQRQSAGQWVMYEKGDGFA